MKQLREFIDKYGFAIYPFLFAIFPLLFIYGANSAELKSENINIAVFVLFSAVILALAWALSYLLLRDVRRASLMSVVVILVFFMFGRIHSLFGDFSIRTPGTPLGPTKILIFLSVILLTVTWFGVKKLSTNGVNTAGLALTVVGTYLAVSSFSSAVSPHIFGGEGAKNSLSGGSSNGSAIDPKDLPDVYYILLDGYGRQDYLASNFDYDNSDFINRLKEKGFYIADKANTNYPHTHLSVPSTFNMKYLDEVAKQAGEESNDRAPLRELTQHNQVANDFKELGYKYVQIGSQWSWTMNSPIDDINVEADEQTDKSLFGIELNDFAVLYLQTTALKPWISSQLKDTLLARVTSAFGRANKVPELNEPTMTFAHISVPHPPYLFDKNGPVKDLTEMEIDNHGFSDKSQYIDQTIYTNKLTLDLINTILSKSNKPPIIVLASDHGPAASLTPSEFQETDPSKFDAGGIKERTAILNAYYFPDKDYSRLYPNITPVNTFRLILSQYFNKDLPTLPDKSYFADNKESQYRFMEVTNLVSQ